MTTPPPVPTPRTNAVEEDYKAFAKTEHRLSSDEVAMSCADSYRDLCRQLERELIAANEKLAELQPTPPTCKHDSDHIIRGYQDKQDIAWCGDCGQITWGSDGLIPDYATNFRQHSAWIEKNVIAFGCNRESENSPTCSEWCGGRDCPVSLRKEV